jgi:hypothetical protein
MVENEKTPWKRLSRPQLGVIIGYPVALLGAMIAIDERDPSRLRGGIAVFTVVYFICAFAIFGLLRWWNGPDR